MRVGITNKMIDNIPYPNEVRDEFTQTFYEESVANMYKRFEKDVPGNKGRSELIVAINSALFNIRIGWLHTRAFINGLSPRSDISYDAERGYHFKSVQSAIPIIHQEIITPRGFSREDYR